MKNIRNPITIMMPLALLISVCMAQDIQAGVRVKAAINTPSVRIQFSNMPLDHYRIFTRKAFPVRVHKHFKIGKQDRMIARRLARYTGLPARVLVNARARGYTWFEIGRRMFLPRPVVLAAMHKKTWKHFLSREHMFALLDFDTHPKDRVLHIDPEDYDGDFDDGPFGRYKGMPDDD